MENDGLSKAHKDRIIKRHVFIIKYKKCCEKVSEIKIQYNICVISDYNKFDGFVYLT